MKLRLIALTILVLSFSLAQAQTAPAPGAQEPMKAMAADADPTFLVATIKPGDPEAQTNGGIGIRGRNLSAHNVTLKDMLMYAFDLQVKQIAGEPTWADKDRFDIAAVPDAEGRPSFEQTKSMCRKLLADRFGLTVSQRVAGACGFCPEHSEERAEAAEE